MTKKEIATHFLHLAAKGKAREAFDLYIDSKFIHHNAYFKGDQNTLMLAMEENAVQNPNKIFEIQRILEDDNLVAVHSRIQLQNNDMELAVMHIFRFQDNKIVELWDFGQPVPKDIINENGMF
ncbi:nuclear transport factor 2 family protein [Flavobacterium sp. J27]|uniref:nuclear transport factor 2 family protein n=1 Tax=Flavobacterium sp. J27 TaxID=2060419 RepID=UPI00102FAFB4|nr:nuclear transport factor 2 family protein [Flavobacterium sp. J27]